MQRLTTRVKRVCAHNFKDCPSNSSFWRLSSKLNLVRGLAEGGGSLSSGNKSLNLSLVGGVGDESGELAVETILGKLHNHIELIPELLLIGLSSTFVILKFTQTKSLHNSLSAFEAFILGEVAKLGIDIGGE